MSLILSGTDGLSDVDGSAATPAIRGTDANTGIFFPAADTIAFSDGGVEAARFNSNGSLAIGTTSTTGLLSLNRASGATDIRMLVANTLYGNIYSTTSDVNVFSVPSIPLLFGTNNTERMRISNTGNVGIGTNNPSFQLHIVNGGGNSESVLAQFGTGTRALIGAYSNQVDFRAYNGTNDVMTFTTGASERMRIDSSGNVGIGTNSPSNRLSVVGGTIRNDLGSAGTSLILTGTGSNFQIDHSVSGFATLLNSGGGLAFNTNGSERMRINSSGLVGIGTNNPDVNLDVRGSGVVSIKAQNSSGSAQLILNSSGTNISYINYGQTGANLLAFYDSNAGVERMRIDSGGNLLFTNNAQYYGMNEYSNKRFMNFKFPPGAQFGGNLDCTDFSTPGNGSSLVQMRITQGGSVGCRGAFSGGQTLNDYAEYFEWSDENPNNEDRIGVTVVLDNGRVRPSTQSDAPSSIIGVVSATAGVVLGSAPFEWSGKYQRDEFGRIKTYTETWVIWTDESGSHNYKQDAVPSDVIVPETAEVRTYEKQLLSDNYDESVEYENREHRPEWACVGLVGQVHVKKGQAVGDRWIKMKDVSDNVEIWFIR